MRGTVAALSLLVAGLATLAHATDEPRIDADFPGGNIRVVQQEGSTFLLATDLRDTQPGQWWFAWCFRLRGAPGTAVRAVFTGQNPIGVRGPAVSVDGGRTWSWAGAGAVTSERRDGQPTWSFEARVPENGVEARYAMCPTYLGADLEAWIGRHGGDPGLRVETLCQSRAGRRVELVRAGCLDPEQVRGTVLLTARHHCCEAMASFVMEGFLDAVLGDDELGRAWRERWEVVAVPFVDRDGVEAGDQGKNRSPHDHNRDYNERPIYPEVAAIMALGERLGDRVAASVDLHCPTLRGEWNDRVYLVGAADPGVWAGQQAFGAVLERVRQGPIPFRTADCLLPYGKAWNTANNTAQGRSNGQWAGATFRRARVATTIETAYADAFGVEVNPASARALGRDLARALLEHLGPDKP